jgi:uncharacterized membrane protein
VYAVSVWIHVVAAAAWVGSMIFFAAVAVPVLRSGELKDAAPRLIALLGARYRVFGWVALGVLVVTGVTNLFLRGIRAETLSDGAFWSTTFGRALAYKLALVVVVLVATLAHEAAAMRTRRAASWLGRGVLLASLAILYFATALVRGF